MLNIMLSNIYPVTDNHPGQKEKQRNQHPLKTKRFTELLLQQRLSAAEYLQPRQ